MARRQSGSILTNIAATISIIGLLLGGLVQGTCPPVPGGKNTKNAISDFNGIASAHYAYQEKFGAFPGNDPHAASRWPGAANGSGDGNLTGAYNNSNLTPLESNSYWQHLRL